MHPVVFYMYCNTFYITNIHYICSIMSCLHISKIMLAKKIKKQIKPLKIQIVTNIARERSLAAVLDTSTVVIAADSINISNQVLEILNKELPSLDIENVNEDEVEEFSEE